MTGPGQVGAPDDWTRSELAAGCGSFAAIVCVLGAALLLGIGALAYTVGKAWALAQ